MKKGDWYKLLIGRMDESIGTDYYFEASFIAYGLIEDRLTSVLVRLNKVPPRGVAKKVSAISKIQSVSLQRAFRLDDWDGTQYRKLGFLTEILAWADIYRNPMQHILGDPRQYHALYGGFHNQNTKDLAVEGKRIARELSAAVMRFKKK